MSEDGPSNDTYRSLLAALPGGQILLEESYAAMDKIMKEVITYTDVSKGWIYGDFDCILVSVLVPVLLVGLRTNPNKLVIVTWLLA